MHLGRRFSIAIGGAGRSRDHAPACDLSLAAIPPRDRRDDRGKIRDEEPTTRGDCEDDCVFLFLEKEISAEEEMRAEREGKKGGITLAFSKPTLRVSPLSR